MRARSLAPLVSARGLRDDPTNHGQLSGAGARRISQGLSSLRSTWAGEDTCPYAHCFSTCCKRNKRVPKPSLERIRTGMWLASSVYHAQIVPLPLSEPETGSARTLTV